MYMSFLATCVNQFYMLRFLGFCWSAPRTATVKKKWDWKFETEQGMVGLLSLFTNTKYNLRKFSSAN